MSFLQKEIWLPKTFIGKFFLSVVVILLVVYLTTVTSRFVENGYAIKGDFVCEPSFEIQTEYTCPFWYTGVAAISALLEMMLFMTFIFMPLIIPLSFVLFVWLIIKILSNNRKSEKINFTPGQNDGPSSGIFEKARKVILYLFIAYVVYIMLLFVMAAIAGV